MLENVNYTEDKNFISIPQSWTGDKKNLVPVSFIDELIERKLSSYDLEKLMAYRNLTRGDGAAHKLSDLVGENLEGKWVSFYFGNYDDSEWVVSDAAKTVTKSKYDSENDPRFTFITDGKSNACYDGTCEHDDTEWNTCSYGGEDITIYNLSGETEVFVGTISK